MKIELDEKSIRNIINFVKDNPQEVREVIEIIGNDIISVLLQKKYLELGAKLHRGLEKEINWQFKKEIEKQV